MVFRRILSIVIIASFTLLLVQCNNKKKVETKKTDTPDTEESGAPVKQKPKLIYDSKGNITERHAFSYRKADGSVRSRDSYYYTYDDSSNITEEIKESYNNDGSLKFKNVNYYSYDHRNLRIDLVFESYNEDDVMQRTAHHSFKYNERGDKTEDIGYREDGSVKSRILMEPNEAGMLMAEEYLYYDEEGTVTDHKKYYYTEYGLEKTVDLLEDK